MRSFLTWSCLAAVCWLSTGCFGRFIMTEKELRDYYRNKAVKPTYFTIRNDSVELFCASTGADTLPPLLMIHGAPGAWYGSRNMLDDTLLQKHYQLIAMDRPGYHKSKFKRKRRAVTSISTQATAIHEAMRLNRSGKKGVVLGSSYGGPIAAKIAAEYPAEFCHLIMLAPAIDPDHEKFWWFNPYINGGPVSWFLPRFINNATAEKYSHVEELRKLLPDWQRISIPVTTIQGGADDIVDPLNLDFARKILDGKEAAFIFIPDAGHMIRFRNADTVRTLLLNIAAQAKVD
ncbi:MAG: alpha/beta hydrolase [Candidatus Pseudobacter hemicellulosilyticus]|uniref:Alpha/beta hydrolase n=1 Tax=Candidatus Pseudobacter hemicellulosilyticus TaxID=3121375 RepID=A0AAJ5WV50_9BACT|nr:MAG: alpha/beta hydrolase [Pseudobacter sp.]